MSRWLFFVYGVGCYLLFFAVYVYFALFAANVAVPKSIDSHAGPDPLAAAAVNLGLVLLFAAQHSIMARPAFKRIWTRLVPEPIERSTYVLFSTLALVLLMWQWRGLDAVIWDVTDPVARGAVWVVFILGWISVPVIASMISSPDLFGLRQVWFYLKREPYRPLPFRTPLAYARVRHPLYLGWAVAFWATPTMTFGHLLFAASMTVYMVAATVVEERDLLAHFGEEYAEYRRRVPRFVPRLRRLEAASAE